MSAVVAIGYMRRPLTGSKGFCVRCGDNKQEAEVFKVASAIEFGWKEAAYDSYDSLYLSR
eukprot:1190409-Prorocentrum_minimum.AAC.5